MSPPILFGDSYLYANTGMNQSFLNVYLRLHFVVEFKKWKGGARLGETLIYRVAAWDLCRLPTGTSLSTAAGPVLLRAFNRAELLLSRHFPPGLGGREA